MHLFVRPNPMNPKADIVFTLSQSGAVRVGIYDLRGRLVATIQNGNLSAGQHSIPWEGSTASGNHAASGLYFVKVTTAHETEVLPVTVLK
jgi:flagellar hook assembly protein FlgD